MRCSDVLGAQDEVCSTHPGQRGPGQRGPGQRGPGPPRNAVRPGVKRRLTHLQYTFHIDVPLLKRNLMDCFSYRIIDSRTFLN